MHLTSLEIGIILEALAKQFGPGYSEVKAVGQLQAKLSIMMEVTTRMEAKQPQAKP